MRRFNDLVIATQFSHGLLFSIPTCYATDTPTSCEVSFWVTMTGSLLKMTLVLPTASCLFHVYPSRQRHQRTAPFCIMGSPREQSWLL